MDDMKLAQQSSSARLIHLAEQEIFPFLEERIKVSSEQMSASFLQGKDVMHEVAFISALITLKNELTLKMRRGDLATVKLQR